MTSVTFIQFDGTIREVDAEDGHSLMEVAIRNGIAGIDGDCGGACACATCHIHVVEGWFEKLNYRSETESDMLEQAVDLSPQSRLACQITVEPALAGLTVRLPESQH